MLNSFKKKKMEVSDTEGFIQLEVLLQEQALRL